MAFIQLNTLSSLHKSVSLLIIVSVSHEELNDEQEIENEV